LLEPSTCTAWFGSNPGIDEARRLPDESFKRPWLPLALFSRLHSFVVQANCMELV
jgi:hypothetical protein